MYIYTRREKGNLIKRKEITKKKEEEKRAYHGLLARSIDRSLDCSTQRETHRKRKREEDLKNCRNALVGEEDLKNYRNTLV